MNNIAISVKNLSKKYRLYDSPQHRLKEALHPFRKKYHRDFWALKDVSFEIRKGETVGIVGRNGSGKSTLLQIICGILQPSEGEALVRGRISALLELGAGFNPEFTGRENVYMSGAVLGFAREEMDHRFADIAAFADIGDFVDQPVKTYSSGMYVRLAFSVSINVDPEILIVDEALSVGDEAFQRKCFSRINDFKKRGKTILFVSHAASTIVELCDRAVLIDQGELLLSGLPKTVVSRYHKMIYATPESVKILRDEFRKNQEDLAYEEKRGANKTAEKEPDRASAQVFFDQGLVPKSTIVYEARGASIREPMLTTLDGERVNVLVRGQEYVYLYKVDFEREAYNVRFGMLIKTISGLELGGMVSHAQDDALDHVEQGAVMRPQFKFRCALLPGVYFLNAGIVATENSEEVYLHRIIDAVMFRVQPEAHQLVTGMVDFSVQGERAEVDIITGEIARANE
jgi:lipopolysaccharide transport system ATP-binding protein